MNTDIEDIKLTKAERALRPIFWRIYLGGVVAIVAATAAWLFF